jgi:hypothetical protein
MLYRDRWLACEHRERVVEARRVEATRKAIWRGKRLVKYFFAGTNGGSGNSTRQKMAKKGA